MNIFKLGKQQALLHDQAQALQDKLCKTSGISLATQALL